MASLEIPTPDDLHVHLRQDGMLGPAVEDSALHFGRVLVMPNLTPPVKTGEDAFNYRESILALRRERGFPKSFEPLMTIKITGDTTPEIIREAHARCAIAGKLYPEGVTTNSEDGVRNIWTLAPVFKAMEEVGMVLSLHGEVPGVFCMDREYAFLSTFGTLAMQFPKLRIVLEHITTQQAVKTVRGLPSNVAATITVHHLVLTLDDVVGGMLSPHNFCKPIAKSPEDREVLREAATSGHPKFFLGTDSAPHVKAKKECSAGCAGVYTSPVAMPILTQVFEEENALGKLADFTSTFGARFYGLPAPIGKLRLEKGEPYKIPDSYGDVVPLWAGREITWRAERL